MSYNGYNQYSPYWQQNAGQSAPQSTGQHIAQSRNSYQPLSAYQSNQQSVRPSISHPAENSSGTSYSSEGYGNVNLNGAGNGRPHDHTTSYARTNDRASLDGATALGNLAYASSLGRNGPVQQSGDYNRQQSNTNYGTVSPYGVISTPPMQNRTVDERRKSGSSSKEDTNARAQQSTASPAVGYTSTIAAYQGPNLGNIVQTQSQYPQSGSVPEQHRLNQYSQQPRQTNDHSIQRPRSRPDTQAALPPTTPTTQSMANQSQGRNAQGNVRETMQSRVQTPQQSAYRPLPSKTFGPPGSQAQRPQTQQDACETGTQKVTNSAAKSNAATYVSTKKTALKQVSDAPQSPTVDASRQASKPATPVEPQYTTVDPSQVFNHVEYSRRQAAAAAEVAATKKAAEEAEAARKAATQVKSPQVNGTSVVASASGVEPDSATKDQMELEMKQMIEKMRDYKAKDPSLFSQIWEQVKKNQPPQRTPSQSLQSSAASPVVMNGQLPSPSLIQSQLPPQSDLAASDGFPPDFDRGRFPAQRRRRGGGVKASTGRKSGTPTAPTKPVDQTHTPKNQTSPVPPELAIPVPKVGQIFPDPRSQSMQEAMEQFHQKSKSPVPKAQQVPVSNKQTETNTSTSPLMVLPSTASPSQPVSAQSAPPPKPGGTYWPESKKKALAEAARIALTTAPPNQGKTITTQEIHELLDQNPSYIQMCEIIEYRGFVIDRGQFARTLLKAVPDLGSASNSTNAASTPTANVDRATPTHTSPIGTTSNTTAAQATSAARTAGSFGMLVKATSNDSTAQTKMPQLLPYSAPPAAAAQLPNAYVTPYSGYPSTAEQAGGRDQNNGVPRDYRVADPRYWLPNMPPHPAGNLKQGWQESALHAHLSFSGPQQTGSTSDQALDQNGAIHTNGVPPHPTKQEMARKRTFDEIVDLTEIPDEEELERHRQKSRTDHENALGPSKYIKNVFDQGPRRQQNSGRSTPKPFKYKYSGRDALLQSYDIIEPMNKRRDALRRSTYNPKTIARDILLGIGRHPSMAPLNAHLDVLKDKFKAVDNESDLSTFRWDLVDPEEEAKIRRPDTDDEEEVPTVNAETRPRPAPTAVMVSIDGGNIAKGDHISSIMRNSGMKQSKRGPYKKTGIRSEVQPIGTAFTPERQSSQSLPPIQNISNASGIVSTDLSRFAYESPYTVQANMTASNESNSSTPATTLKRKGRPPGAKNKQVRPDKGIPKKHKTPSMGTTPSTAEEKALDADKVGKPTPSKNPSIDRPTSPLPARPRINTTTPSRPSGLRNSISAVTPTTGIAVVIPSRSPSVAVVTPQASARKGRPKQVEDREDGSNGSPSSAPKYTMCPCRFDNCPAELHNLETLRKHVKKHCRAVDGVYPCLWAGCSDSSNPLSDSTQNEDGLYKRLKFKTDAEWVTHVESNHLRTEREL